eukprot:108160-Pleurochrysis_carterae.AAC.9
MSDQPGSRAQSQDDGRIRETYSRNIWYRPAVWEKRDSRSPAANAQLGYARRPLQHQEVAGLKPAQARRFPARARTATEGPVSVPQP